jgi:gamma-glutamyltranspeptidase / glutathione hydrolase
MIFSFLLESLKFHGKSRGLPARTGKPFVMAGNICDRFFGNNSTPALACHVKTVTRWRQRGRVLLSAFVAVGLAACSSEPEVVKLQLGEVIEGFVGGVSGDEPRASLVAQDVLASGGTAADAATAMALVMGVTYPAAASLGGGGSCLISDSATQTVETLNFLPVPAVGGGLIAVPGMVRGIAALHSRYGRMSWEVLISKAEELARKGHNVSRALADPMKAARPVILNDLGLSEIFMTPSGKVLGEGSLLSQIPLSSVLAQLRVRGPGEFYFGNVATNLVNGAQSAGGALTMSDFRNYQPSWHETVSVRRGDLVYHTSRGPMTGGIVAGQMWAMLKEGGRSTKMDAAQRAHLMAEVSMRAYAKRGSNAARPLSVFRAHALMTGYLPNRHDPLKAVTRPALRPEQGTRGSTAFVVVDREGSAVSCVLSMGRPFGAGKAERLTGIVLSSPPKHEDLEFLSPVIILNKEGRLILAAAAAGGPAAPAALADGALSATEEGKLSDAVDAPRLFHPGNPDVLYVEPEITSPVVSSLRRRGHTLRAAQNLGRVNAIYCPGGLDANNAVCEYKSDQRGFGLAAGGQF